MYELDREPTQLMAGSEAVQKLFRNLLFQPDSVHPLTLSDSYSLILIQSEDDDGNQIRFIVAEDFECAPHNYSMDYGYYHYAGEDPVGLMTYGTRIIIDIDNLEVRTIKFEASKNEIQGYFYACEQMIYGGPLEPEDYLSFMTRSLQQYVEQYTPTPLAQHCDGMKIWERLAGIGKES